MASSKCINRLWMLIIAFSHLYKYNNATHAFVKCSKMKQGYSCKNISTVLTVDHKYHRPMVVSASQQHTAILLFIIILQPSTDKTAVLTINKSAGGRLVYFYQCRNPGGEGLAGLQLHPLSAQDFYCCCFLHWKMFYWKKKIQKTY